jgi:hypothetical protein
MDKQPAIFAIRWQGGIPIVMLPAGNQLRIKDLEYVKMNGHAMQGQSSFKSLILFHDCAA